MDKKKNVKILTMSLLMIGIFISGSMWDVLNVFGEEPGTKEDPIVSKSYVDENIKYRPVKLEAGQRFVGSEGTEVIIRSGETKAVVSGENGIPDITVGKDVKNNEKIELNHLVVIPRSDGRGFLAETLVWILVRGNYEIM